MSPTPEVEVERLHAVIRELERDLALAHQAAPNAKGTNMPDVHAELFKGDDGDWYFRIIAVNGEELARSSEGYRNRGDAIDAIVLILGESTRIDG